MAADDPKRENAMGMLGEQAIRLLRDDWNTLGPQALAEEIYAIFNSDEPVNITSPLTIAPQGNVQVPPLTINNSNNFPTSIVINNPPFPQFPNFQFPSFDLNTGGITSNLQLGDLIFKQTGGTTIDQITVPQDPWGLGDCQAASGNITVNGQSDCSTPCNCFTGGGGGGTGSCQDIVF